MMADEQGRVQVVVVTGATSGVGRAVARRFAAEGARIGLIARGADGLAATVADVESRGGVALPVSVDVADPTAVENAADAVEAELGPIDVWVNNAMTTTFSFFEDCEPEEFRRATDVTYLGTVWGTRAALGRMRDRDEGVVIQVGSALTYRGKPLQAPYCGAKHAMKGFTESVRSELLHKGSKIHIGMVQLPAVNTPQFSHCRSRFDRHPMPVPPVYAPEVAADAVHLAVKKRRREIYVGLPTVKTILGSKVASAVVDRYLARYGVESQLSGLPPDPANEEGNLFVPVPGDRGAEGVFGDDARTVSPVLWVSRYRGLLTTIVAGTTIIALAGRRALS
jgi:NAD(P)-dependent dehydrogenase (short-subunit alcohol dehydrogenase family)